MNTINEKKSLAENLKKARFLKGLLLLDFERVAEQQYVIYC